MSFTLNPVRIMIFGAVAIALVEYPGLRDPINLPKLVTLLVLGVFGALFAIKGTLRSLSEKNRIPSDVVVAMLLLLFIGLSALRNNNWFSALFGFSGRFTGFLAYMALIFIYIAVRFFASRSDWVFLLKSLSVLGTILTFYGALQFAGLDFVKLVNPYNPLLLTFGNPNFASTFLAYVALANIYWISQNKSRVMVVALSALTLVQLAFIYFSDSQQGLLVFSVGLFVFIISIRKQLTTRIKSLFFSIFSITLIGGVISILAIERVREFLIQPSLYYRYYYWIDGWRMFADNWLLGVGWGQFSTFFRQYRDSRQVMASGPNVVPDHAHNYFIHYAATGGILVIALYVALIALTCFKILTRIRRADDMSVAEALLFALFFGQLAQSLISIDNLGIVVWQWITMGLILANRDGEPDEVRPSKAQLRRVSQGGNALKLKGREIALASTLALVMLFVGVQIMKSSHQWQLALSLTSEVNSDEFKKFKMARLSEVVANPYNDISATEEVVVEMLQLGYVQEASDIANTLITQYPERILGYLMLNSISEYKNLPAENEKYARIVFQRDPFNYINNYRLVRALCNQGKTSAAQEIYLQTETYASNTSFAKEVREQLAPCLAGANNG